MYNWYLQDARSMVQVYPAGWWIPPSPDGRWLAAFTYIHGQGNPLSEVVVTVYDLNAGVGRVYRQVAQRFVPGGHGPPPRVLQWTDDNRLLVEGHTRPQNGSWPPPSYWRELNLTTGATISFNRPPAARALSPEWEAGPDGWLVYRGGLWGPVRLRAPDGREVQRGVGHVVGWSSEGHLLVVRWETTTSTEERTWARW